MKTLGQSFFKTSRFVMAAFVLAFLPAQAWSQESKEPAVVISIASINEQLNDVEYMAKAAGGQIGDMSGLIRMQAMGFLGGVDLERPAGAILHFPEGAEEPSPLLMVPVKVLDDFLDTISRFADVEEGDLDTYTIIPDGGEELILKKLGSYAVVSNDEDAFASAPENPEEMLAEMSTKYNIAAKINVNQIPESLRDQAIALMRGAADQSMDSLDDSERSLQQKNIELQLSQMESLIKDTDEFMFGFVVNQDDKVVRIDVELMGSPGSEMAKRIEVARSAEPTQFGGFLMEDAAFNMNLASNLSEADANNYKKLVKDLQDDFESDLDDNEEMTEEQKTGLRTLASELFGVLNSTLEEGRMDMGVAAVTEGEDMNLVMGTVLSDPGKVENAIKEVAKMAESDEKVKDVVSFKLNSFTRGDVVMHEAVIKIPEDEEEMTDMFGDEVNVLIGIGEKKFYVGLGENPKDLLQKAMEGTGSSEYNMQWNLSLAKMFRFASNVEGAEMMDIFAEALEEAGNDRVRMTTGIVDNAMKIQLEIQDGIFKMMSAAGEAMSEFGGGADF